MPSLLAVLPFALRHRAAALRTRRLKLHAVRGTMQVFAMLMFFYALSITPLAKISAVSFTAPLFATLGAIIFLGERVRLRRMVALALGFLGAMIIIRPGVIEGDGANPGPKEPEEINRPWFIYVNPKDVAQAVQGALETDVACGAYNIVAGRKDTLLDFSAAQRDLGYEPQHNWPEIPEGTAK